MASLDNCFVDEVREPVQLIEVGVPVSATPQDSQQTATGARQLGFLSLQALTSHFKDVQNSNYTCRFISICQRNSWRSLQISRPMLDLVVSEHEISPLFWDLPSCFYTRSLDIESVFCIPYTESRTGSIVEILYTVKYPEYKPIDDKWTIRQSGIYHRFNTETRQSLFILFSPTPNSKAHQKAEEWLRNHHQEAETEPFWLHNVLSSTYFPAWRQYIAALEREFLPIVNSTFSTFIEEPLRLGYDNLSALVSLENRFLQIPTLLEPATDILTEISVLVASGSESAANHLTTQQLKNLQRQCVAYSRTATHLHQRVQVAAQLLADTLSFRDQVVANEQNRNMLKLNKSAVFLTTMTLLYLPASFVTQSFFGMNFFGMDQDNNRIVGTSMVWIFVVSSCILTAVTFLFYNWLSLRDGVLFRRYGPRARLPSKWTMGRLLQKMRTSGMNAGIELQNSRV